MHIVADFFYIFNSISMNIVFFYKNYIIYTKSV